jgi:ParB-like chromosome segregation protein Spo0J
LPTVSHRANGTYVLLDGQTRFGALKLLGSADDEFACTVYEGLNLQQEAEMFQKLNNTKKPGVLELFSVRVTKKDPTALGLNDLLKEHGYIAERGHVNSLSAIGTAELL